MRRSGIIFYVRTSPDFIKVGRLCWGEVCLRSQFTAETRQGPAGPAYSTDLREDNLTCWTRFRGGAGRSICILKEERKYCENLCSSSVITELLKPEAALRGYAIKTQGAKF